MPRLSLVVSLTLLLIVTPLAAVRSQTDAGKDFVQGDRVLIAEDFARTTIGMFPRSLRLLEGNVEVASVDGRRALRTTSYPTVITVPLPEMLPERFTVEFQYVGAGWDDELWLVDPDADGIDHVFFARSEGGIRGGDRRFESANGREGDDASVMRVAIMADGNYVKVYSNDIRVANVPSANLGRSRMLTFRLYASKENPVLLSDLRIAAGGKDLYRALTEEGRMTLEGIEFDLGKATLRAGADSVLRAVASVLVAKTDLSVSVEGHTDDTGNAAANQTLSEQRAAAVRERLIALGVPAPRLVAAGRGASEPIASNETPEGRQRNRRVELIRQ